MEISFDGKVALVTGAAAGIGLATAQAFAQADAAVALADVNVVAVQAEAAKLVANGQRAIAIGCDVTDEDAVAAINLRGAWTCMKHELLYMREHRSGTIVNCSSIGGLIGLPGVAGYHAAKHGVIGLTRSAALEYATRGIWINAVCPGSIDTPMIAGMIAADPKALDTMLANEPIGRLGRPEEIANAVLWLCSPLSSFVLGHALAVDGGFTV